jgi:hypothetical protein
VFDRKQPLWLPPGSVRSIIALVLVVAVITLAFRGAVDAKELLPLASLVVGAYFVSKAAAPRS